MAETIMNVQVRNLTMTTAQWETWVTENPTKLIIPKGFMCVELQPISSTSPVQYKTLAKIGDGVTSFTSLPYVSYTDMVGATTTTAGKSGLVPAPAANYQDKYLAGDGTWKELPVGALYKVAAVDKNSGATDKLGVYKSVDGGSTWTLIGEDGEAAASGATFTSTLGLFATTATGDDEVGKIKSSLLPSYVDDIIEGYYNSADGKFYKESTYTTEITGEAGKIYVDVATDHTYRWSGSVFIKISDPISAALIYELCAMPSDGNYDATHHGLVPAYGSDNKKVLRGDGWATLSGGTGITVDDSTTAHTTSIKLDAATSSTIGGVSVPADSGLTLGNDGALSASVADASTLGSVKVGSGLSGAVDGTISVAAATSSVLGGVTVASDSTISNTSGAIDVKVDGTTITKNSTTGALSAAETVYTEGSGINITNKVVSINNTVTAVETETLAKFTYDANGLVKSSTAVADTSIVGSVTYDTANSKLVRTALDGTTKTDIVNVSTAVNTSTGTSSTDLITAGAVNTAIAAMDGVVTGSAGAGKTLTAFSETDGVVTATFGDISITSSQISNKDTTLVQSVRVNGGTAITPATAGSINLSGIVTGIDYTNSSGTSTTLAPGSNGNIDLTQLTFNCVL